MHRLAKNKKVVINQDKLMIGECSQSKQAHVLCLGTPPIIHNNNSFFSYSNNCQFLVLLFWMESPKINTLIISSETKAHWNTKEVKRLIIMQRSEGTKKHLFYKVCFFPFIF